MPSPRQSVLADRHRALGSNLGDWNDMDVAWEYDQDVNAEHRAVRTAAGLFDVSGLKKLHITGPDALAVVDHVITRDMSKITPGRSVFAMVLNEEGRYTDDCIAFHIMPNHVMFVHGGGTAMEQIEKSAKGKEVSIHFDDDLHDLSFQGPKAVDILNEHTPIDLPKLKYFHQVPTTLFGHNCVVSRTGFSGERGYEIFTKGADAGSIWDNILEHGKPHGVMACSFNCLDMIRVEAGLLFYPFDINEEHTPWEAGLDFAVSKKKQSDYRGKEALMAAIGKEKVKVFGIVADCETAVDADAELIVDGKNVGVVTQPMYSTIMNQSLAIVRIDAELAKPDVKVEVKGPNVSCSATTHTLPFYDPNKDKRVV